MKKNRTKRLLGKFTVGSFLFLISLTVWWPLWFMITASFMPEDELVATIGPALDMRKSMLIWHIFPSWPTLDSVLGLLLDTPQFFSTFWNTTFQVFAQILGQFIVGVPAAWALSKFHFPGRRLIRILYIVLMLFPFQVTMVPTYLSLKALNLLDTIWAVILPGAFSTFPVFIMIRGFGRVPKDLLDAAAIDGATNEQTFLFVGLPLGIPSILSALTLSFLEAWNAIEQPMTFLKSQNLWPLSLYLSNISTENLGVSIVASVMALLPSVLIFGIGKKYLELGIQSGALKG